MVAPKKMERRYQVSAEGVRGRGRKEQEGEGIELDRVVDVRISCSPFFGR